MVKRRHPFALTAPCSDCPFRTDGAGIYLSARRVRQIERDLDRATFNCHKTVDYENEVEDDTGRLVPDQSRATHCAGALILLRKLGRDGDMQQVAKRLGVYAPEKLDMSAPVYESFDEMAGAQIDGARDTGRLSHERRQRGERR